MEQFISDYHTFPPKRWGRKKALGPTPQEVEVIFMAFVGTAAAVMGYVVWRKLRDA